MYESNNDFDMEDDEYMEFYACAFRIKKVIKKPKDKAYKRGSLIEISIENEPTRIILENGDVIWEK